MLQTDSHPTLFDAGTRFVEAPIKQCIHSRFNTRKTRSDEQIQKLADRIRRNGFERTRALWAVEVDGHYEVFAGGTRLEAAKLTRLKHVPVFVHDGLSDEEISRKADEDNENDEYHERVGLLDVWAEYHRLSHVEGWTQEKIAASKSIAKSLVCERVKWHTGMCQAVREKCSNGLFDEGHIRAINAEVLTLELLPWLTTEQVQAEIVDAVLAKHVGSSVGVKPTVKSVREIAKRWKTLIAVAEEALRSIRDDEWGKRFVQYLSGDKVRSEAGVQQSLSRVVRERRLQGEQETRRLQAAIDEKQREAQQLQQEERRLALINGQTAKLLKGDARELIDKAPDGFHLLLTDPPYGMQFQSNRRVASPRKAPIANDGKDEAFSLLADVLDAAYPKMAENSVCLIFTGWRYEPQFRQIIEQAGFAIKGSLVWAKKNHGAGDLTGTFAPKHERIIHAVKGNPKLQKRAPDVLSGNAQFQSTHPTEKPRDLLHQLIDAVTAPGDIVVDPFFGSGGALAEAYAMNRDFFGVELENQWHTQAVDVIHKMAEEEVSRELAV